MYGFQLIVMDGRWRDITNGKIWGKKKVWNYDGNRAVVHCLSGTKEITYR